MLKHKSILIPSRLEPWWVKDKLECYKRNKGNYLVFKICGIVILIILLLMYIFSV